MDAILKKTDRKLVLESGEEFAGWGFGGNEERVCELAFCTAAAGYQELLTDPGCAGTAMVMTYPLIGNTGIADEDNESRGLAVGALLVREYNDVPSNFRYTKTLAEAMEESGVPGIAGLDTRMLTRLIRDHGSCRCLITSINTPLEAALATLRRTPEDHDAVKRVSCRKRWYSRTANPRYHAAAIDCGIKMSEIRALKDRGCNVTVFPYNASLSELEAADVDGVLVAGGPGSPDDIPETVELIRALRGRTPVLGIGLGCLAIALAYGAQPVKMKCGHHGGNHPVRRLSDGRILITAQGHSWTLDADSLADAGLEITHIDLTDHTVEGIACRDEGVYGVLFNPEGASGPRDAIGLYDEWMGLMKEDKENA